MEPISWWPFWSKIKGGLNGEADVAPGANFRVALLESLFFSKFQVSLVGETDVTPGANFSVTLLETLSGWP